MDAFMLSGVKVPRCFAMMRAGRECVRVFDAPTDSNWSVLMLELIELLLPCFEVAVSGGADAPQTGETRNNNTNARKKRASEDGGERRRSRPLLATLRL